jgi:hypothetical protein
VTGISNYGARDPLLSESGLLGFRLGVEASDWAGSAPELGLLGRGMSGGGGGGVGATGGVGAREEGGEAEDSRGGRRYVVLGESGRVLMSHISGIQWFKVGMATGTNLLGLASSDPYPQKKNLTVG